MPAGEPIEVYYYSYDVPSDSEALGLVKAADSGTTATSKCDSLTAVEHLKEEARKIGGNAVYVSNYTKPRGSTCHQMEGTILRVYDFESLPEEDVVFNNEDYYQENVVLRKKQTLPRMVLGINAGYGWRTAKADTNNSIEKDYWNKLNKGAAFDGSFTYYFNDFSGISATYSALTGSSGNGFVANMDDGSQYKMSGNSLLNYAGLDYAMRMASGEKWVWDMRIGLGYADYKVKQKMSNGYYFNEWGSTVGLRYVVGVNYRLTEQLAVALDLSTNSGLVGTVHFDDNGYKSKLNIDDADNKIGLGRIQVLVGVRYYIK